MLHVYLSVNLSTKLSSHENYLVAIFTEQYVPPQNIRLLASYLIWFILISYMLNLIGFQTASYIPSLKMIVSIP